MTMLRGIGGELQSCFVLTTSTSLALSPDAQHTDCQFALRVPMTPRSRRRPPITHVFPVGMTRLCRGNSRASAVARSSTRMMGMRSTVARRWAAWIFFSSVGQSASDR